MSVNKEQIKKVETNGSEKEIHEKKPSEISPLKSDQDIKADTAKKDKVLPSKNHNELEVHKYGCLQEHFPNVGNERWIIFFLSTLWFIGALTAVQYVKYDPSDDTPWLMKLWPKAQKHLIHFTQGSSPEKKRTWVNLTSQLDTLLSRYESFTNYSSFAKYNCSLSSKSRKCKHAFKSIIPECTKINNYGYDIGKPCIFFEFSNITNWQPEPYTIKDLKTIKNLPEELKNSYNPNLVFLKCEGDTIVDKENIGLLQYSPYEGFPSKFFPFRGQKNYLPPLVAVRFANPVSGIVISVTCKLWAKNIGHKDYSIPSGKISFYILID